jgi:putative ABC transport system substrate-binding protein
MSGFFGKTIGSGKVGNGAEVRHSALEPELLERVKLGGLGIAPEGSPKQLKADLQVIGQLLRRTANSWRVAVDWPRAIVAANGLQESCIMKRVGIIVAGSAYPMDGFKSGLRDFGWVEGERISFELRAAEGQLHLLPEFAAEMVSLGVNVIAVIGAITVRAVRQATSTIPIVFAVVVEPIGDGLATNLERPGGNVTGVTTFDPRQATDQLEFLRVVNPDLKRVAILSDLGVSDCMSSSNREAARDLLLEPQVIRVEAPSPAYDKAFAAMKRERAQALIVLEEPINQACRKQIADLAAAHHLPTVFPISMLDAGGLIAYGTSLREAARQMAQYADDIFRGASPGDLPIKAALAHELVVNLQTARRLGITVPVEIVAKANQVIQ